ncbi:MAG: tRNA epoxyqueuosine(34) reductase QueG [Chthonomonas sp.]|nr:tRNA epoxyqueuosine(34) reductase QueG [Chthonomonas sp.]
MTPNDLSNWARDLGFGLVGVCSATEPFQGFEYYKQWLDRGHHAEMGYLARQAHLKSSLESVLPGAKSAIVVGMNYAQPNPVRQGFPRIARYALGRDYHRVMRRRLATLAKQIGQSFPEAMFRACVDSAPIFERELANRAGLGWFGKNSMLINSRQGSMFLIGVLLTSAELPYSTPAKGGCGTCKKCIEACPTGAIVHTDGRWNVDSRKCISFWTIEAKSAPPPNIHKAGLAFGCDICQEVCPFNEPRSSQPERARTTDDPNLLPSGPDPSLDQIRDMSEAEWDSWTRGRAIRRSGYAGWKRNIR